MTPQTYKEQDFEEQISKKNYYHIFIEAANPKPHLLSTCMTIWVILDSNQ